MGRLIREIRESPKFSVQCEDLGGAYKIDRALDAIKWILSANAEVYPVLPGLKSTRLVVTNAVMTPEGRIPKLRVYFKIVSETLVELVWIEEVL